MYALAQRPDIQARLRDELRAFPLPTAPVGNAPLDSEALAALDKLPLLDAVVRETLRLYAPVPATIRTATVDSVLPLATPYVDRHGVSHAEIRVGKDEPIIVPILLLNRSKELWGPDAHEWKCVARAAPPRVRCVLIALRVSQSGPPFRRGARGPARRAGYMGPHAVLHLRPALVHRLPLRADRVRPLFIGLLGRS
jgi:hypothetical protein